MAKWNLALILLFPVLLGTVSAKTIYKCGGTYQDLPCKGEVKGEVVQHVDATISAERKKQIQLEQAELSANARIFDAIAARQIVRGMTASQVIRSWGKPNEINQSSGGDQWVYNRGGSKMQFVYLSNGIVTGWN
jgi:cysteine synthase